MKILFVCTGNVFRSVIAEKCFNNYCTDNNLDFLSADSAGTNPSPQPVLDSVKLRLADHGIHFDHQYKQITTENINKSDQVIAMHKKHQEYLEQNFNIKAPLFNKIAYGVESNIIDIEEKLPHIIKEENFRLLPEAYAYTQSVVDYIHEATPFLVKNILEGKHEQVSATD